MTFGREIPPEAAHAMLDTAWRAGWTMFDTASAYGGGASERIVGEWWRARQPAIPAPLLATKILPPYEAATVLARLHASLDRLQRRAVDVLYLHQWHESALDPGFLATLQAAVEDGLVGALGASNFNADQLARLLTAQARAGFEPVGHLQNIHNYAVSGFDRELVALCAEAGIRRVGYSPLGAGFLTGKYRTGVPAGSRFDLIPGHQKIYFTPEAQVRLARLTTIAAQHDLSPIDLALAWALRHSAPALTLIGGRSPDSLERAIRAPDLVPGEVLAQLDAADAPTH